MSIERFFIIANRDKDKNQTFSEQVRKFVLENGRDCRIAFTDEDRMEMRYLLRKDLDGVIVLGGDGTVLEAAHLTAGTGTPIVGINIGNLGYLAEIENRNWQQAMYSVLNGDYEIENRMMLQGYVEDSGRTPYPGASGRALNDIVITRNRGLQVLKFRVYVDGQFLNRFSADGIIVSTPTGSTAYSMSAGGPIVEPKARMILMTLISPHTLNNRSFVLSADDHIVIEMEQPEHGRILFAECDFDGTGNMGLQGGDRIVISAAPEPTRLIRLSRLSFLETLQRKM